MFGRLHVTSVRADGCNMLSAFQLELDARHDKYERLVKLSRDLTVESKRTIFLLHRITSTPDMEEILTES
jgi:predicted translin family RNA/ssDNA-binding protein